MTVPPDHVDFTMSPNDDDDPQREAAASEAVRLAIRQLAKQHGIKVHEEPGAIEPDARENPERAKRIEEETGPKLLASTAQYRKIESTDEQYWRDGTLKRRQVAKIVEGRGKLDASLREFDSLAKCIDVVTYQVELACKAVNWVCAEVPSRKR